MKVKDIAHIIEKSAPKNYAESWDNPGIQVGNIEQEVNKILVSLDFNIDVLNEAIAKKVDMIITHHPFIFNPIRKITTSDYNTSLIIKAIQNNITIYAAHTNLDNADGGLNFIVADILHLQKCTILEPEESKLYKIITFIPKDYIDTVRDAIFEAGGGCIGNYDLCSYYSSGEGTFRATKGTHPFVGKINEMHYEPEYRLEIIVPEHLKDKSIQALLAAHPYEEPAYDIVKLDNKYQKAGSGSVGYLPEPMEEIEFLNFTKSKMMIPCLRHSHIIGKKISKVAICTGAGAFLINKAISCKADAFVTADVKYHEFYIPNNQLLLIDAGHYETEQFSRQWFIDIIKSEYQDIDIEISQNSSNPVYYL